MPDSALASPSVCLHQGRDKERRWCSALKKSKCFVLSRIKLIEVKVQEIRHLWAVALFGELGDLFLKNLFRERRKVGFDPFQNFFSEYLVPATVVLKRGS